MNLQINRNVPAVLKVSEGSVSEFRCKQGFLLFCSSFIRPPILHPSPFRLDNIFVILKKIKNTRPPFSFDNISCNFRPWLF